MRSIQDLRSILRRIDGRGYKAYRDIVEAYDLRELTLQVDHVQADPFAPPSRLSVKVDQERAAFPSELFRNKPRRVALQGYITRAFDQAAGVVAQGNRGTGRSGFIGINCGRQEILERTSVLVDESFVEARFVGGLPAMGRRIAGRQAEEMLLQEIPEIVSRSLICRNLDADQLRAHIEVAEDQEWIRAELPKRGLVAFVANGSILPRRSGVDDRPLEAGQGQRVVVPFQSPPSLEVELCPPNRGTIRGMGIPEGVTLIVGGGFHGKSTLLNALERGVYNHVPGDGREYVVTIPEAVKVRAEDGRGIERVDISPFISNLPFGRSTTSFSTDNASGSTSQAANIVEALEVGVRLLLIDEDTSATNFMIRDSRMQQLVPREKEPITPFLDQVEGLKSGLGVSTILVMGGSGDYFDVADTVIMMDEYNPQDVSSEVKRVVEGQPTRRKRENAGGLRLVKARCPLPESFDPRRGRREVSIDAKGLKTLLYGVTGIDLSYVEQLLDIGQTRAIGHIIHYYAESLLREGLSLRAGLEEVFRRIDQSSLDILLPYKVGNLVRPRIFEVAAAVNRMRTLKMKE